MGCGGGEGSGLPVILRKNFLLNSKVEGLGAHWHGLHQDEGASFPVLRHSLLAVIFHQSNKESKRQGNLKKKAIGSRVILIHRPPEIYLEGLSSLRQELGKKGL